MQLIDNIPVFGAEVDEGALSQIKTCYYVFGRAAMMADHHKGYGVPIGGVIAHPNLISPSGVGYDIGCFVGQQKVALADGRNVSLLDLMEEQRLGAEHFGYALDGAKHVVVAPLLGVRQTGWSSELIRIDLNNGEPIFCTPDHLFEARDGSEVRADALKIGDSLMPLYIKPYKDVPCMERSYRDKRMKLENYLGVYNPATEKWDLVHHLADEYNLGHGLDTTSNGMIRHHVNFNKFDNRPTNIKRMEWKTHFLIHSDSAKERAAKSEIGFGRAHQLHPEFFSRMGSENMSRFPARPDFAERVRQRAPGNLPSRESQSCKDNWAGAGQRGRAGLIAFNRSTRGRIQSAESRKKPCVCSRCGAEATDHSAIMKHYHERHAGVLNHEVVAVTLERLPERIPVYCLTVPKHHTFALSAGVFVHNCGNKAVLTDAESSVVKREIGQIMDEIAGTISFGVGRRNAEQVDHELFDDNADDAWQIKQGAGSATWRLTSLRDLARQQLGTVGGGNHYVDIFEDEIGRVWIGVHFGSRGFGHKIATRFLTRAGAKDNMDSAPVALDSRSTEGEDYIAAMKLAGRYAYAGRDWVCQRVAQILGANILTEVHNHHNFAWREEHGGELLWVVRKGATPAFPGQLGFVGGSMGDNSFILQGVENDVAQHTLYSTVHGAGRVMGRREAAGAWKRGVCHRPGKITPEMMGDWIREKGVTLRGGDLDEAPQAYKRIVDVLREHEGTVRILHTLTPLGVAMAGREVFDPYKD